MQYFYPSAQLTNFWYDVVQMVEENYSTLENSNDVCLIGCFIHKPIYQIKKEIDPNNYYNKFIAYQLEPLVDNHWWSIEKLLLI